MRVCRIYHSHYTDFDRHTMLCGSNKIHMCIEKFCNIIVLDTENEPAILGFRSSGKNRSEKSKKDQKRLDTLILMGTAMRIDISMKKLS